MRTEMKDYDKYSIKYKAGVDSQFGMNLILEIVIFCMTGNWKLEIEESGLNNKIKIQKYGTHNLNPKASKILCKYKLSQIALHI